MLSVIVVADCRCRCWGTANYSSILMRGRKIGSQAPGIGPGPNVRNLERYQLCYRVRCLVSVE